MGGLGALWAVWRWAGPRLKSGAASVSAWGGIPSDIRELRQTMSHVRDMILLLNSRSLFTLDSADLGLFECDPRGQCTFANKALAEIFGLPQNILSGQGWLQAISEDERYQVHEAWSRFVKDGIPFDTTFVVHNRPEGKRYRCLATGVTHKGPNEVVLGYLGVVQVTEAQNA